MAPRRFDISVSVFQRLFSLGFGALRQPEKTLVCVRALVGEVDNAGFHSWLYHSTGRFALETPAALRRIGAPRTAALVEDVLLLCAEAASEEDDRARRAALEDPGEEREQRLEDLDRAFRARSEDLEALLSDYIASHEDQFVVEDPLP